jgi:hypothetical protein
MELFAFWKLIGAYSWCQDTAAKNCRLSCSLAPSLCEQCHYYIICFALSVVTARLLLSCMWEDIPSFSCNCRTIERLGHLWTSIYLTTQYVNCHFLLCLLNCKWHSSIYDYYFFVFLQWKLNSFFFVSTMKFDLISFEVYMKFLFISPNTEFIYSSATSGMFPSSTGTPSPNCPFHLIYSNFYTSCLTICGVLLDHWPWEAA